MSRAPTVAPTSARGVTLSAADHERPGAGYPDPDAFIHVLRVLARTEPKRSILGTFDVSQIAI